MALALEAFMARPERWTAQRALALLPESPVIFEVIDGSLLVSPRPNTDHQRALRELGYLLNHAARPADLEVFPEINVVLDEDLFHPDLVAVHRDGEKRTWFDETHVVMVVEIMSPSSRRLDRHTRPKRYAEARIPYYLRVEFRGDDAVMILHSLAGGEYRPIASAAGGSTFVMTEPFRFELDPNDLLDP